MCSKDLLYTLLCSLILTSSCHPLTDDECLQEELIVDQCHPCDGSVTTGRLLSGTVGATETEVTQSFCYLSATVNEMLLNFISITGNSPLYQRPFMLPDSIQSIFQDNSTGIDLRLKSYKKITAITAALKMSKDMGMTPLNYRKYQKESRETLCKIKKVTRQTIDRTNCKLYAIYRNLRDNTEKLRFIYEAVTESKNIIDNLKTEWEVRTGTFTCS